MQRKKPVTSPKEVEVPKASEFIQQITGTMDPDVASFRLEQMARTLWLSSDPAERAAQIQDMHGTLSGIKPGDVFERMLGYQMVACFHGAMECHRRAMIPTQIFEVRQSALNHAAKLSATYAKLLDALNKHRGKGQQRVTVEHVHVAPGGQAIVGNVDASSTAARRGRHKVAPPQIEQHVAPPNPLDALNMVEVSKQSRKKPSND